MFGIHDHPSSSTIRHSRTGKNQDLSQANSPISAKTKKAIQGEASTTRQSSQMSARHALTTHSSGVPRVTIRVAIAAKSLKHAPELPCARMNSSSRSSSTCCVQTSWDASSLGLWCLQRMAWRSCMKTLRESSSLEICAHIRSQFLHRLI